MSNPNIDNHQNKHPIIGWFITNPVASNLLMLFILLGGLYTVGFFGLFNQTAKIPLESFPAFSVRTITIEAKLNGLSSNEIEDNITQKIEKSLQGIQGIEKITSKSRENIASITVTIKDDYSMDILLNDIQTEVDNISNLPQQLEKISVKKKKKDRVILWVTLYGNSSEKTIKHWANQLKDELLIDPIIERIEIAGEKNPEISVEISQNTLKEYDLSLDQVAAAINQSSINLSVGELSTSKGKLTLSIKEQASTSDEYGNIIIRRLNDGSVLKLKDIANISDQLEELDVINDFNGHPSLSLQVYSGSKSNVIEGSKQVRKIVKNFKHQLPQNIQVALWRDSVVNVKDRINLFTKNILTGIILVFIFLTLFLNLRLALWVALGIPVSFAGALLLMQISGITINLITLFGFIIVLGIVVDDAIIIGESIYTSKKRTNNHPNATIIGASKVSTAATFGVLTTIAAFLPLTQVNGELGNVLSQIGWVVIFCLIFSLVESKLILPSHLYKAKVYTSKTKSSGIGTKAQIFTAGLLEKLTHAVYLPLLKKALLHRYFTLLAFISILILAIGLVMGGIISVARFPVVESNFISLSVSMDNNVNAKHTQKWAKKATQVLNEVDKKLTKKGQKKGNITHISAYTIDEKSFKVFVGLESAQYRTISAPKIANAWREALGDIPQSKSVNFLARQRFSSTDIEIRITSNQTKDALKAKDAILAKIASYPGIKDVSTTEDDIKDELIIHTKPQAAIYGVNEAQIASAIRNAFYGVEAERLQRDGEEVRILLRLPQSERQNLFDIENFFIKINNGQSIPISEIADFELTSKPTTIHRLNKKRVINIYANVDKSKTSSDSIIFALTEIGFFSKISQQFNVNIDLGGEAEDGKKSDNSMKIGFIISLIFIYILLAIPLKSYTKPLLIMSVIPFGIIGAIFGHLLLNINISIISMFGIIALSGVVVNDSLLLISAINQHRQNKLSHISAIIRSSVRRFRPILLTSITTFIGVTPILFETSFQAQFLIPMAISLGFGILFATTITLLLVPVLYLISRDIKRIFIKTH